MDGYLPEIDSRSVRKINPFSSPLLVDTLAKVTEADSTGSKYFLAEKTSTILKKGTDPGGILEAEAGTASDCPPLTTARVLTARSQAVMIGHIDRGRTSYWLQLRT